LVDLAESESVDKTGAEGERLAEAKCINKSLSFLVGVIHGLRNKKVDSLLRFCMKWVIL